MRELVRALALDPTNREHVAMFATVMSTPQRTVPPEVKAKLGAQAHPASTAIVAIAHAWSGNIGAAQQLIDREQEPECRAYWCRGFPMLWCAASSRIEQRSWTR